MPSYREFYPERLVTGIGLYEAVLIDTTNIQVIDMEIAGNPPHFEVSKDVEALHKFLKLKERIMLPCPECLQNQPFDLKAYYNPQKVAVASGKASFSTIPKKEPVPQAYPLMEDGMHHNIFDPPPIPHYRVG